MLSTRRDSSGANVTRVGFGTQSLKAEDGAKFALELVEAKGIALFRQLETRVLAQGLKPWTVAS